MGADPAKRRGRLTLSGPEPEPGHTGGVATDGPPDPTGVVTTACMKEETRCNTGSPTGRDDLSQTGSPRGSGRAFWGGGEARSTVEAG